MHPGQLFPAVCFLKNLIPDAVKYWFSLTSVKALYTLSNKIFLPFWASMNDLTRSPSFHNPVSSIMPVAVVAVIPNRLSLVSLWLREAQRWWLWKTDSPTFPLITIIIRGKSRKNEGLQEPVGRIAKTSGLGERDSSKFLKEMLDCIVYSSFDVRVIRQLMSLSLHIVFLIKVTSARVLTGGVVIDQ